LRWQALGLAAVLTLGAIVSPWWECSLGMRTWSVSLGNGGARVWWLTGGRAHSEWPRFGARLGTDRAFLGWWLRCNPYVWVPNAWIPAWMLLAPVWLGAAGVWKFRPGRDGKVKCLACKYDLSGVPAREGRIVCPECGDARPEPRASARAGEVSA
jgi:hypothetical protein